MIKISKIGMVISFLEHFENNLSVKLSSICTPKRFHVFLIVNQNNHKQVPNYYLMYCFSFADLISTSILFMSIFIIIPFS